MTKPKSRPKPYADTKVGVDKSRTDISKLLEQHGVTAVQWTTTPPHRSILRFQFIHAGITMMVRLVVDPPRQGDPLQRGLRGDAADKHWKKQAMRLHRTLYWAVKSKLEVIESGLESPIDVWLPAIESGQQTFAERIVPNIADFAEADYSVGGILALPAATVTR